MTIAKPHRQGVGIVLRNHAGLVFTGCRADCSGEVWQLPQGGMEPGETASVAAFRELREETGCAAADLVAELPVVTRYDFPPEIADSGRRRHFRGQEHRWVLMRLTGTDGDIDLTKSEGEFRAWRWAPPALVIAGAVSFKRAAYEAVFNSLNEVFPWP